MGKTNRRANKQTNKQNNSAWLQNKICIQIFLGISIPHRFSAKPKESPPILRNIGSIKPQIVYEPTYLDSSNKHSPRILDQLHFPRVGLAPESRGRRPLASSPVYSGGFDSRQTRIRTRQTRPLPIKRLVDLPQNFAECVFFEHGLG